MSLRTLTELIHGKGAHADVLASVKGLTSEQASRVVPALPHSVWQLVAHMSFWMRYEFKRIAGTPDPYPATASVGWPSVPEKATQEEWQNEVAEFERLIKELEHQAQSNPESLECEVTPTHPSDRFLDRSVLGILWQLVAHNSYHIGQVVFLRHALNLWPPAKGSDTW